MQHAIVRTRVGSTHGTDLGPGSGLAAPCRAAQARYWGDFWHAALPACYNILIYMCMPHGMHEFCVTGAQDPRDRSGSVYAHSKRLTLSDVIAIEFSAAL